METNFKAEAVQIPLGTDQGVSGVLGIPAWWPSGHRVGMLLAHDVGSNLDHELLQTLQNELTPRGYLTLRFNFPFVEQGRKRPDNPAVLERSLKAALAFLLRDPENAPARLFVIGMGLGCKTAAQAMAQGLVTDGLICLGYPLHPSGKPNQQQAESLFRVIAPMLFVQGTRDPYCRIDRLQPLLSRVGAPTRLHRVEDADHSLGLIRRTSRTTEEIREEILSTIDGFVQTTLGGC